MCAATYAPIQKKEEAWIIDRPCPQGGSKGKKAIEAGLK